MSNQPVVELSNDIDIILALQGVRGVIDGSTIAPIFHCRNGRGVERVNIDQTPFGGITPFPEHRVLDWTCWEKGNDNIFDFVIRKARRIPAEETTDKYLDSGWLPGVNPKTVRSGRVQNHTGWK